MNDYSLMITYPDNGESEPTVSGRALHEALDINTPYTQWFERMRDYGFIEGLDFFTKMLESTGGRPSIDHDITLDMAKELCMIQRNDKGKAFREYFIRIERSWNDPVLVMGRALEAQKTIADKLRAEIGRQDKLLEELSPKVHYYDTVINSKDLVSTTEIAKDFGKSAKWLNNWLHVLGVQFKRGERWFLYQEYSCKGYAASKTETHLGHDGTLHTKTHMYWTQKGRKFIYDLLVNKGVFPVCEAEKFKEKFS